MIIIPKSIKNIPISKLLLFSNGDFSQNGSGITTIDGDNIATGQIESVTLTSETSTYTSAGALFDLTNAEIKTPYFILQIVEQDLKEQLR